MARPVTTPTLVTLIIGGNGIVGARANSGACCRSASRSRSEVGFKLFKIDWASPMVSNRGSFLGTLSATGLICDPLRNLRLRGNDEGCHDDECFVNVTVSVLGRDAVAVEELRSLFTCLRGKQEFRGRVRLVETAPEPGTLGGWPEALAVALGEGGAITVLASAVMSWIRHRPSDVTCTLTLSEGRSVTLATARIRGTDLAGFRALLAQTVAALEDGKTERIPEKGID